MKLFFYIIDGIRRNIPVGYKHHKEPQGAENIPEIKGSLPIVEREYESALCQVGTLGGGNHFIELQKGSDGHIWIMLHSGSRNLGTKVADHYDKVAKNINKYWYSVVPVKHDLAFLPIDSDEGKLYMKEMQYCVDFALANRQLMMTRVIDIFKSYPTKVLPSEWVNAEKDMINIAHNYAAMENHFGENVMVHRKGATKATEGLMGIIPGSQGSSSYIVKGKGNRDSFKSCSHGAGRAMGRKDATRKLNLEEEQKRLDDMGVIHSLKTKEDLDESIGAYKDIDVVMANQSDLVDIEVSLRPLGAVKEKKEKRKKRW